MSHRLVVVEGPVGVGKSAVARALAERLEARVLLEEAGQNPFLTAFQDGVAGSAFQAEIFFLLSRYRQHQDLRQQPLFDRAVVLDSLFEKSRLYAFLNLDDSELVLYEKLYSVLAEGVPRPDLVVYLQAPTEVLLRRLKARGAAATSVSEEYLAEVNRAYNHYFFHYTQTPLLVVNTAEVEFDRSREDMEDLLRQIRNLAKGTQYYVPLARG